MPNIKPELTEIATTSGGRDVTRGYIDGLELLSPQDAILIGRAGGDYRIYEEILRDDQVASTFQQRRLAVVSREWEVEPGGTNAADVKAADHLREIVKALPWDGATDKMLYGLFYGFSVAECLWARDGSYVTLDTIKVRKQRRFRFAPDHSLRLLTTSRPQGEVLPERKFWVFSTGADNDDEPYGLGLAYWLYWPVWFKRHGIKFWLIFLEKFGTPTAVGEYQANASEEDKRRLLAALQAIQTDAALIHPQGMLVKLLEATRGGTVDQRGFLQEMNEAIAKIVLSQTMTTDDGASLAQGQVHLVVRDEVVKADADLISASFNRGPARWLTEWNHPGAAVPRVWRKTGKAPDLKAQAEREKIIVDMGVARPTLEHIVETYGGEWEPAPPRPAAIPPAPPAFAERGETVDAPDVVDAFTGRLEEEASGELGPMLEKVRELVSKATSFAEIRDELVELYGELDPAKLAQIMQRAFVAAELAGRAEVADEGEGTTT